MSTVTAGSEGKRIANDSAGQPVFPPLPDGPLRDSLEAMEGVYVETRFHRSVQRTLQQLFKGASVNPMHRGLILIGPTGSGKTAAVRQTSRWLRKTLALGQDAHDPIAISTVTASTTPKALIGLTLTAGREPLGMSGTHAQLETRLHLLGPRLAVHGLAFDECHHVRQARNQKELIQMTSTLKNISNAVPRPLVLMGIPGLDTFVDSDPELARRFSWREYLDDPVIVEREDVVDVRAVLSAIAKVLPTESDCDLRTPEMLVRLLVASRNRMGALVGMVKDACLVGADEGAMALTREHLVRAFNRTQPPASHLDKTNPFLMPFDVAAQLAKQTGQIALKARLS